MASSEPEMKLGVTDHPNHPETGRGADGEKKKPTKLSDFSWVSVLCCRDCSNMISFIMQREILTNVEQLFTLSYHICSLHHWQHLPP